MERERAGLESFRRNQQACSAAVAIIIMVSVILRHFGSSRLRLFQGHANRDMTASHCASYELMSIESEDESRSRSRTPPPRSIASPTERDGAEAVAEGEAGDADGAEDTNSDVLRHWEEVAQSLLDPIPVGGPWCTSLMHRGYYESGIVTLRRVKGLRRWVLEEMAHLWDEVLSGVSASTRSLVVCTRGEATSDPFRTCQSESRAVEVFQQCDDALRTRASEPPWDLLRIELFEAFGNRVQGNLWCYRSGDKLQTSRGARVLHALRCIEKAAHQNRAKQCSQGNADACLRALDVAIARSLTVAQNAFEAACKGLMQISVATRAKVIHALMVRRQLVVAQEVLIAREARRPRSLEEAVAKIAEASLAVETAAVTELRQRGEFLSEVAEDSKIFGVNVAELCGTKSSIQFCFPRQEREYLAQHAAHREAVLRRVFVEQDRGHAFERRWKQYKCPPCQCMEKDDDLRLLHSDTRFVHILNGSFWHSRAGRSPWSFEREDEFYEALQRITFCLKPEMRSIECKPLSVENALELAVVVLEETIARAFQGRACFLDLFQKVEYYAQGAYWTVSLPEIDFWQRLVHIDAIVKASPMVRAQVQDFCKMETQDIREVLEQLPTADAVEVMKRGALLDRRTPVDPLRHDSMRTLRSRLFSGMVATEENARACARLFNAEFAELYRGMSFRELVEEVYDRGIPAGRDCNRTKVSLQQRLRHSDALWVTTAKITVVDIESHAYLQAKELVSELTDR